MAPEFLKKTYRKVRRAHVLRLLERAAPSVDAFLVSYPKSGRTWLRYILSCYFAESGRLGFEPDLRSMFHVLPNFDRDSERGLPAFVGRETNIDTPLIAVSHRRFEPRLFAGKAAIILLRDPRDVCVSAYFHQTRHKQRFEGCIGEFIEDDQYGIPALVRYHNGWGEGLERGRTLAVSYERMSRDTASEIRLILDFLGRKIDETILERAIRRADFSEMQKAEKQTGIPGHDYDRSDSDSLRVRKGKVGGYAEALGDGEAGRILALCDEHMSAKARQLYRDCGIMLA